MPTNPFPRASRAMMCSREVNTTFPTATIPSLLMASRITANASAGDEVESSDIIKGYEVGKGEYIEVNPEELEAIALESKRKIEIVELVHKNQIDVLYMNNPYFIVPDGEVGALCTIACPSFSPKRTGGSGS